MWESRLGTLDATKGRNKTDESSSLKGWATSTLNLKLKRTKSEERQDS